MEILLTAVKSYGGTRSWRHICEAGHSLCSKLWKNICSSEDMCRILHDINLSFLCKYRTGNTIFLRSYLYLCFADKLLNYSLCLLMLMQLRKALIISCDQRDMLKWDHMLNLGFRELGSVFVSLPRLFQHTRKHDLFLKNSTWSKILLFGHRLNSAFI